MCGELRTECQKTKLSEQPTFPPWLSCPPTCLPACRKTSPCLAKALYDPLIWMTITGPECNRAMEINVYSHRARHDKIFDGVARATDISHLQPVVRSRLHLTVAVVRCNTATRRAVCALITPAPPLSWREASSSSPACAADRSPVTFTSSTMPLAQPTTLGASGLCRSAR